jgi:hypothetical protein
VVFGGFRFGLKILTEEAAKSIDAYGRSRVSDAQVSESNRRKPVSVNVAVLLWMICLVLLGSLFAIGLFLDV